MGFECGFSFIPKFYNDLSDEENFKKYLVASSYLGYVKNSWAKEHYKTFEDYIHSYSRFKDEENVDVDLNVVDKLESFHEKFDLGEYDGYSKDIEFWCSIGRNIDDEIYNRNTEFDDYNIVNDEFMKRLNEFISDNENSSLYHLQEVSIDKGFIVKKDDEYPDENTIISRAIDGIEVCDNDGHLDRIYANNDYGDYLLHGDIEYSTLMDNLIKARDIIDIVRKDYIVYYWRSY